MKMNYLLDKKTIYKNREKKNNNLKIILIAGVAILIYIFGSFIYEPLTSPILAVARPLLSANTTLGRTLNNTAQFFTLRKQLVRENNDLKVKLLETERLLFTANTKLKSLPISTFLNSTETNSFTARVMAKPRFLPYDILLLSSFSGQEAGVGQLVFWGENIILGEIVQTTSSEAKARLYSSGGTTKNVLIDGTIPAVLEGRGGGNFVIQLPRGLEILIGSRVYLADKPNLVIAIVGQVAKVPEKPFQTIYARTPVNINTLDWVAIKNDL